MENKYQAAVKLQDLLISNSHAFHEALQLQKMKTCQELINDITAALSALAHVVENQDIQPCFDSFHAMLHNITWTVDKIIDQINDNQDEKALDLIEFQLIPFMTEWREDTYFWFLIYPDREKMNIYYETEFARNHKNNYENRGEKYLVSIFIPVYNKLEYTKKCLDSLYRYTDFEKYQCELILLNDGSTDETDIYFESLGIRKVLTLKENVKTMIFSLMYRVCQGKYAVFVNNDTILTSHWLDNLLACIKSDETIISVVPSTPNTSNLQSMTVRLTPENVQEEAKNHNKTNPLLWEERSRLMPVIALYDINKVNTIGFADRYFYTMEFWDDDFSFRARRAGYKQILCRDTWCYHFGSVSGGEDQVKHRTLENGRELFLRKHGVDAWGEGFCYDPYLGGHLESTMVYQPAEGKILGIDTGFGGDVRHIKNMLKRHEKYAEISLLLSDSSFENDFGPCKKSVFVSPSIFKIHNYVPQENFNYIYIGKDLSVYPCYEDLLTSCVNHLRENGILAFYIRNPYSITIKNEILEEKLLNDKDLITLINMNKVITFLQRMDLQLQLGALGTTEPPHVLRRDYTEHIERYLILCTKKTAINEDSHG
ncbi:glycosyltransferase [Lachnospiraceae bacterium 54-53]